MPLFTAENAAEFARRSAAARAANVQRLAAMAAVAAALPANADEAAREQRLLKQMDQVDGMLDRCREPAEFVQLTNAKARLWNLLFPTAGVSRPKSRRGGGGSSGYGSGVAPVQAQNTVPEQAENGPSEYN
jgi:hypothetical protein